MKALTIRLIHDEEDGYDFFNSILSPLLDHVECDVYIVDDREATEDEQRERLGEIQWTTPKSA